MHCVWAQYTLLHPCLFTAEIPSRLWCLDCGKLFGKHPKANFLSFPFLVGKDGKAKSAGVANERWGSCKRRLLQTAAEVIPTVSCTLYWPHFLSQLPSFLHLFLMQQLSGNDSGLL